MQHRLREAQLTLLGTLPAARMTITLHVDNGVADRSWWLSAVDEEENQVLLWSDRTSPGPNGGLNLAELMVSVQDVLRLAHGDPPLSQPV